MKIGNVLSNLGEYLGRGVTICENKELFAIRLHNNDKNWITTQTVSLKQISFGWFFAIGFSREPYDYESDLGKIILHLPLTRISFDWSWCFHRKE